jgi:hypothetical protein
MSFLQVTPVNGPSLMTFGMFFGLAVKMHIREAGFCHVGANLLFRLGFPQCTDSGAAKAE